MGDTQRLLPATGEHVDVGFELFFHLVSEKGMFRSLLDRRSDDGRVARAINPKTVSVF